MVVAFHSAHLAPGSFDILFITPIFKMLSKMMPNFWRHCAVFTWKVSKKYFTMFDYLIGNKNKLCAKYAGWKDANVIPKMTWLIKA